MGLSAFKFAQRPAKISTGVGIIMEMIEYLLVLTYGGYVHPSLYKDSSLSFLNFMMYSPVHSPKQKLALSNCPTKGTSFWLRVLRISLTVGTTTSFKIARVDPFSCPTAANIPSNAAS